MIDWWNLAVSFGFGIYIYSNCITNLVCTRKFTWHLPHTSNYSKQLFQTDFILFLFKANNSKINKKPYTTYKHNAFTVQFESNTLCMYAPCIYVFVTLLVFHPYFYFIFHHHTYLPYTNAYHTYKTTRDVKICDYNIQK